MEKHKQSKEDLSDFMLDFMLRLEVLSSGDILLYRLNRINSILEKINARL